MRDQRNARGGARGSNRSYRGRRRGGFNRGWNRRLSLVTGDELDDEDPDVNDIVSSLFDKKGLLYADVMFNGIMMKAVVDCGATHSVVNFNTF